MRITKSKLRRIIKEEINQSLTESYHERGDSDNFHGYYISQLEKDLGFPIERMPELIDHGYTLAFISQDGTFLPAEREGQKLVKSGYYFCDDDCEVIDLETRFDSPEAAYREAGNREDGDHYTQGPGGFEQWDDTYYSRSSDEVYREGKAHRRGRGLRKSIHEEGKKHTPKTKRFRLRKCIE